MSTPLRRDILIGAVAGLIGGLVFGWALQGKGMMADTAGLIGFTSLGAGFVLHLLVSALVGASFGAIFRFQSDSYAASMSSGILYGMLWWILGPLTLSPILMGRAPTWELGEAGAAFFNLMGHLLYGGVTGLSFYVLVMLYVRWRPRATDATVSPATPPKRIVILGGGFGGVSAAQRLEQLTGADSQVSRLRWSARATICSLRQCWPKSPQVLLKHSTSAPRYAPRVHTCDSCASPRRSH